MYRFPAGDHDQPVRLTGLLGSFWSRDYGGAAQVRAYADAVGRAYAQVHADLLAARDCLGRATVPTLQRREWAAATVRASALRARRRPARFGGGRTFGDGLAFGDAVAAADYPTGIAGYAEIPLICNRLVDPDAVLVAGLDYVLDGGEVVLRSDLSADARWARRPVFDDAGGVADEEITLWLFRPGVDRGFVHGHHGYLLGLELPGSEAYRSLVDALLDAVVSGSALATLQAVLEAVTGVPAAAEDGEVVAAVGRDGRGLGVVTDRRAYRLPGTSAPLVAPGAVLAAGQPLCDAVRLIEPNRGLPPDSGIRALALGRGLLAGGFLGDLVFEDRDVHLDVSADAAGRTVVRFAVSGFPADVARFWDEVDRRGVAAGRTLAQALDTREGPVGQPPATALPATVNPLKLVVDNLLRGGVAILLIKAGGLPPGPGLQALRFLRLLSPVHTAILAIIEAAAHADPAEDGDPGDGLAAYTAGEPLADGDRDAGADGPAPARVVSRTCR